MKVSQAGEMDILWWINEIKDSFSPMQIPNSSFLLKGDASKSGWGAIFDKKPQLDTLHQTNDFCILIF